MLQQIPPGCTASNRRAHGHVSYLHIRQSTWSVVEPELVDGPGNQAILDEYLQNSRHKLNRQQVSSLTKLICKRNCIANLLIVDGAVVPDAFEEFTDLVVRYTAMPINALEAECNM